MAPPVFTVLIGEGLISPGATSVASGLDAAHQWVLTDISGRMVNDNGPAALGVDFRSFLSGNSFTSYQCCSYGRRRIRWRGRQTIGALDSIEIVCGGVSGDPGEVYFRLTGYYLTLP
jgi:hypothetical protein